jgi:hypothetical protein
MKGSCLKNTLYLNSGPSHPNQERRAALTETALKNPVLISGPRGGRFEKICCIGSTSNPSATVGHGVRGCACPGLFPRMSTSCLMVEQPAFGLWGWFNVHGCSLALSSDRSGQGAYGGVSSPPSRDPQCADPSSHKHPQLSCLSPDGPIMYPAGWLRKCLTIGIRESQPVSLMKLPMAYMCVGLVILQGRVR